MKFTGDLGTPRIDIDGYKSALNKAMREAISAGLNEWLGAVLAKIPTWSGASRATFVKLADEIGYNVEITPVVPSREFMGEAASHGKVDIDSPLNCYSFTYYTDLFYLVYNEYNNANADYGFHLITPGPYDFQIEGKAAWDRFVDSVSLPPVAPYIIRGLKQTVG
jgi:hypothetical protein